MKRILIVSFLIVSLGLGLLFASGGKEEVKPEKAPKLVMPERWRAASSPTR